MSPLYNCKIAIVGAGSIGCFLGGCLSAAGISTLLIGRERILSHIKQHGLQVTDWQGRNQHLPFTDVNYQTDISHINQADYILVTVKSADTPHIAKSIAAHAKPNAIIVSIQNGMQNVTVLKKHLSHSVVKGMVPFNVMYNNAGVFHCGTQGNIAIEANQHQYSDLLSAFDKAQLPIATHQDLTGIQWGKLIMNLNNAVNALSGLPLREQLHSRAYRNVMVKVITEALALMKKANITPARTGKIIPRLMPYILALPNCLFTRVAGATLKIDPQARSSMFEDFELGRTTEIDYLNGEILALGHQLGVPTPVNTAIVELVKKAEVAAIGTPRLSPQAIESAIASTTNANH